MQLLSYFGSDRIEQWYKGKMADLETYRQTKEARLYREPFSGCERCGFEAEDDGDPNET